MSKLIGAYLRRIKHIHENCLMRTDTLWVTKILYEWVQCRQNDGTDIQRDIIYHAEQVEPDIAKWDISAEKYEEVLAELRKKYPSMK
jgi:predicted DNA-binding protein (UPF0278 family)